MATGSETSVLQHPEAVAHLPPFITVPGDTDWFMVGTAVFLVFAVLGIGVFYLKLHALPEHMAHRGQKVQFEIVAVLALLALFTHNHAFWIAGLLLAMVPIPDFTTPLSSMAGSLGLMARRDARGRAAEPPPDDALGPPVLPVAGPPTDPHADPHAGKEG